MTESTPHRKHIHTPAWYAEKAYLEQWYKDHPDIERSKPRSKKE